MKRVQLFVFPLVAALVISAAVLAQDGNLVGRFAPFVVDVEQAVPVVVSVPVDVGDGDVMTATVPLTVSVALQVRVDGAGATVVVEDAPKPVVAADIEALYIPLDDVYDYMLTLEDMPEGFTESTSPRALSSNRRVAEGFPDELEMLDKLAEWGRKGGFYQQFVSGGFASLMDTGMIECSIIVYDDEAGARSYLDKWVEYEPERFDIGELQQFQPVSSRSVGEYSAAYKTTFTTDDPHFPKGTRYTLAFVKHNLLVFIDTYSVADNGDFADVMDIALIVEKKLP